MASICVTHLETSVHLRRRRINEPSPPRRATSKCMAQPAVSRIVLEQERLGVKLLAANHGGGVRFDGVGVTCSRRPKLDRIEVAESTARLLVSGTSPRIGYTTHSVAPAYCAENSRPSNPDVRWTSHLYDVAHAARIRILRGGFIDRLRDLQFQVSEIEFRAAPSLDGAAALPASACPDAHVVLSEDLGYGRIAMADAAPHCRRGLPALRGMVLSVAQEASSPRPRHGGRRNYGFLRRVPDFSCGEAIAARPLTPETLVGRLQPPIGDARASTTRCAALSNSEPADG